jgi:hypothetical protein
MFIDKYQTMKLSINLSINKVSMGFAHIHHLQLRKSFSLINTFNTSDLMNQAWLRNLNMLRTIQLLDVSIPEGLSRHLNSININQVSDIGLQRTSVFNLVSRFNTF